MEENKVKVSVVIPIYNVEPFIEECLLSVCGQTLREIEIICVNDGTTDASMEIVCRVANSDNRIIIIDKENGGLSTARNAGLARAKGEYVYFLDSDDYILPETLEKLYHTAEEKQLDNIYFGAQTLYENKQVKKKYYRRFENYYHRNKEYPDVLTGEQLLCLLVNNQEYRTSACLQMLRREFLQECHIDFYEGILHEDNLFSLQVMLSAKRVMVMKDDFYIRRVRAESIMTAKKSVNSAWGYFVCIREMLTFLENKQYTLQTIECINKIMSIMQRDAVVQIRKHRHEEVQSVLNEVTQDLQDRIFFNIIVENTVVYGTYKRLVHRVNRIIKHLIGKIKIFKKKAYSIKEKSRRFLKNYNLKYIFFLKSIEPEKVCVSIIIPVYNAARYISSALDSLINQRLKNIEIICVNDGSTDNSLNILKEYQKKDARIKIVNQDNQGAGSARNKGISVAQGEYLLFLDADDIFDQDLCGVVYYQCINKNADICLFGAERYNMQTNDLEKMGWVLREEFVPRYKVFSGKDVKEKIFQITSGCPWSKMFRREFVLKNQLQFQNLRNCNDAFFVRMAQVKAKRITTVNSSLVRYRYNEGTNIQSTKENAPLEFIKAFCKIKQELQKNGDFELYERSYYNMALVDSLFNLDTMKNNDAKQKIIEALNENGEYMLGIGEHQKEFYYNQSAYNRMQEILK